MRLTIRSDCEWDMPGITVTFIDVNGQTRVIEDAEPGMSMMQVAKAHDVEGILADCGGACSCATCHVYVGDGWMEKVGPPDDVEEALLDMVDDVRQPNSRLSCQISVSSDLDGIELTVAPDPGY
ncbi:2Fe-2S iron-sulfur cluster-binding protein [Sphingomonas oligophenolica]